MLTSSSTAPTPPRLKPGTTRPMPWWLPLLRIPLAVLSRVMPYVVARLLFRAFTTPRIRARHRHADRVVQQARVTELLHGQYLLKRYDWGDPAHPAVVVVHGWESRGTAFRALVMPLLAQGYRVVAFDGPAHGHSSGKRTHLLHHAGALQAVIASLPDVRAIVAHSFGGHASILALHHLMPHFHLPRLVLVGAPLSARLVFERTLQQIGAPVGLIDPFMAYVTRRFGVTEALLDNRKPDLNIAAGLVIHDLYDDVVPHEDARQIADALPNTQLLTTLDEGHFKLLRQPSVVERIVSFIVA